MLLEPCGLMQLMAMQCVGFGALFLRRAARPTPLKLTEIAKRSNPPNPGAPVVRATGSLADALKLTY